MRFSAEPVDEFDHGRFGSGNAGERASLEKS